MLNRIEQLTGLRFFAALLVFASHSNWNASAEFYQRIFKEGYVGVSFFFMLSGFVLSISYKNKISNGVISFKKYSFLRIARLTPLHFATAFPFIVLAFYKDDFATAFPVIAQAFYRGDIDFTSLLLNLTYLQSFIPSSNVYFSFNAPSWSLSNEMFFYICFFPLAIISIKNLYLSTLSLLFIVITSAIIVNNTIGNNIIYGHNSFAHWLFYIFPAFRILEFLVGMIIYNVWSKGIRLHRYFIPISYIALLAFMYCAIKIPEPFRMSLYYLPVVALFLFSHLTDSSNINRFYSTRIMVLLGNASFAFYLIHQPLINIFRNKLSSFNLSDITLFSVSLLCISIASIIVYEIYEKKAERALKSFSKHIN